MRLTAVKLAGFKSFVDPTTFYAPTNLTGIVGPNGCGKSNIIDAVRWVMGEASAKMLRGESMADVIFSGSSTRKPVGTATVELMFDNSDGRVGGAYAGYNEISVKRQVTRDGISLYFLNGSRVRRKDVKDLFLGTGLGSRSYSIIEQGMISEVVDARPEEIRAHLEEAAGISRYKERRRETENRIQHTRDNLARLADLRDEVGKHLNRLQRQAAAANRYRKLKQQKRELDSRLLTLRWRDLKAAAENGLQGLAKLETSLQQSVAAQRAAEAVLEEIHQQQTLSNEQFSEIQGELYTVGGEIARLEQAIRHARELHARQKSEFEETSSALNDIEKHIGLDRAQVEDLTRSLAEAEPALKQAQGVEEAANETLQTVETEVQAWQESFEQHHQKSADAQRQADLQRAQISSLEQRMLQNVRRMETLQQETVGADTADMLQAVESLDREAKQLAEQDSQQQAALDAIRRELSHRQSALREAEKAAQQQQRDLHTGEGKLESLLSLQAAALAAGDNQDWLAAHGLNKAPRLAKLIKVKHGWEAATEVVLGHWLQSVVADEDDDRVRALAQLDDSVIDLVDGACGKVAAKPGSLAAQVSGPDVVVRWLNQVRCANSLEQAWNDRAQLQEGESFLTQTGEWLGQGWIRVAHGKPGEEGMLAREKAIANLRQELDELGPQVAAAQQQMETEREALSQLEQKIRDDQVEANNLHRRRNEIEGQAQSRRANIQLLDKRQLTIATENTELRQQFEQDEAAVKEARGAVEQSVEVMNTLQQQRQRLDSQRADLLQRRETARSEARTARENRHEFALKVESRRASLDSLTQSLQRMDTQLSQLQQRYVNLSEEIAKVQDPQQAHRTEMDALLQRRVETEKRLANARAGLHELEEKYRQKDGERQSSVQQSDEIREQLERYRLAQQELELNTRTLQRQVEELGGNTTEIAEQMPEEADADEWARELEDLQEKIIRLEPVNLAAIEEYEEEKKRKDYLDAQDADLCLALSTLEEAIAKIDRKTRTRFKETFEKVNKGVQEIFPRLFGGGHAYLELTGDDMLTTGVSIMARPPGKRVSSIHLLSGGEKALTAVSFVFSIFQLNPAPFCLLDEVDAPLDDSNVVRFSSMVKEMSETVQFIYVTHNKITMEMAHQLSGVTMREPGVSRLVQVDIDEAAKLAGQA
ncbi:MAG: chromosome segregation protein SMC [Xanthomonadales bacterium]|nr:chromosome segregation protein SMC [Xanthomonadales bacterium]